LPPLRRWSVSTSLRDGVSFASSSAKRATSSSESASSSSRRFERRVRVGRELAVNADQEHARRVRRVDELRREVHRREIGEVQIVEHERDGARIRLALQRAR
jgi:hypothetical protein